MRKVSILTGLVFLIAFLTACQGKVAPAAPTTTPTPPPTPTPTPSPEDYLNWSADAMQEVETLKFTLTRDGDPVVLEESLGLKFVQADGVYQAPDRIFAAVRVDLGGNVLQLNMLWLPEGNFMSNPLTGQYGQMPEGIPLNPAALFADESGIRKILMEHVQDAKDGGIQSLGDAQSRYITGKVDVNSFAAILAASSDQVVDLGIWMDAATYEILRVEIVEPTGSSTLLDFFDYGEEVTIPSP